MTPFTRAAAMGCAAAAACSLYFLTASSVGSDRHLVDTIPSSRPPSTTSHGQPAKLLNAIAARASAADPESLSDRRRRIKDEVVEAIASRSILESGGLLTSFFDEGAAAFDHLMEMSADEALRPIDADALGLLLQTAMELELRSPGRLAPHDCVSLAGQALSLLEVGAQTARLLRVGLGQHGSQLPATYLAELMERGLGGASAQMDTKSQLERIDLIRAWTRDMGADTEPMLLELAQSTEVADAVRGEAFTGLLSRDWRSFGAHVQDSIEELQHEDRFGTAPLRQYCTLHVSEFAKSLPPHERVEFLRDCISDEAVATLALSEMSPLDAATILSLPTHELESWEHLDWVRLAAGDQDSLAAGHRLLARLADDPNPFHGYSLLQRMLKMDPTHPDLHALLYERFAGRAGSSGSFWESLAFNAHTLETEELMAAIGPYLAQSQGEADVHRSELIALVHARMPSSLFE